MTSSASNLARSLLIYAIVLPIAVYIGWRIGQLTDNFAQDYFGWYQLGLCFAFLAFPLIIKWHRPVLFFAWNTTIMLFFFPGRPFLWLAAAFLSLLISLVQRTLVRDMCFIHVPSVVLPVLYLLAVIFATGVLSGGFGLRIFGSSKVGGKPYWMLFAGTAGFLAMLAQRIPPEKILLYLRLFFLSSLTNGIGYAVNFVGPSLWYIFLVFPVDMTPGQGGGIARYGGLCTGFLGIFWYLLARYGLVEILEKKQFGKMFLLLSVFVLTLGGGYRTYLILMGLTVVILAYLEGLFRSKYAPLAICGAVAACAVVIPFADKLPLPIQRSLAVLPIKVDPAARFEAEHSTQWRLDMWRMVLPEIPRYFWLGKGLEVDVTDLDLSSDLSQRGMADATQSSIVAGNYHNGPLTVLIPFGVWGAIGWLWFLAASFRALYCNYRYGDEMLHKVNTLLLALFAARTFIFFTVFGDFRIELPLFLGMVGLGLALNGGIRQPVRVKTPLVPIRVRAQPPVNVAPVPSH
jgi:hypothetical protein